MVKPPFAYMSAVLGVWLAMSCVARAQQGTMDAWASFITAPSVWKGQVVPRPDRVARPRLAERLVSQRLPLVVHARAGTSVAQMDAAMRAFEDAYDALSAEGWPLPFPDGGEGESVGTDLYLEPAARAAAYAELDGPMAWTDFDAAQTYAVVDAGLPTDQLPACVLSALLQASLRGQDPSEAESVARATGDFAAWTTYGEAGCNDSFIEAQQHPERALMNREPQSSDAGGLFLAMLSERHDGGGGKLLRALWELTRQRSRGLVKDADNVLRSSPDLWEAIFAVMKSVHEDLFDTFEDFAVARYFAGEPVRRKHAAFHVFAALPQAAAVPVMAQLDWNALPKHARTQGDGLSALGSAYVRVSTTGAGAGAGRELRVWLRGEMGAQWSMVAVRLAADGGELGRVKAAIRNVPKSYLPVQLTADTAEVVIVVTFLPAHTPDADTKPLQPHGFELIVDKL